MMNKPLHTEAECRGAVRHLLSPNTDLSRGHTHNTSIIWRITDHRGARADDRVGADVDARDDGSVCGSGFHGPLNCATWLALAVVIFYYPHR